MYVWKGTGEQRYRENGWVRVVVWVLKEGIDRYGGRMYVGVDV